MIYIISFNNGHKMEIALKDGKKFLDNIAAGANKKPAATYQFYREGDVLINILEITAIHPITMNTIKE